jgi:hypothetical protein
VAGGQDLAPQPSFAAFDLTPQLGEALIDPGEPVVDLLLEGVDPLLVR